MFRLTSACLLFLLLVIPAAAAAQTVTVVARPGGSVYVVTGDERRLLGTMDSAGLLAVPIDRVDRDTELEVMLVTGPSGTDVALVERGRVDPLCASVEARVACQPTGTFVTWGRVERITVAPTGQVSVAGPSAAQPDDDDDLNWGVGLIGRLDGGQAFLTNDERLCDEARSLVTGVAFTCDVEDSTGAYGAGFAVTFLRFVSFEIGYLDLGHLDFDLNGVADGTPVVVEGRVGRTRGATFTGGVRLDLGWPVVPFVDAGAWRWSTDVEATASLPGSPVSLSTSRSLDGWSPIITAGVEVWPIRNVGVHGGIRWIRIDGDIEDLSGLLSRDDRFRMFFVGVKIAVR